MTDIKNLAKGLEQTKLQVLRQIRIIDRQIIDRCNIYFFLHKDSKLGYKLR